MTTLRRLRRRRYDPRHRHTPTPPRRLPLWPAASLAAAQAEAIISSRIEWPDPPLPAFHAWPAPRVAPWMKVTR